METYDVKIIRDITGKILSNRKSNKDLRQRCSIGNRNDWRLDSKKEWTSHSRMGKHRLVKIGGNKSTNGRKSIVRPIKRSSDNLNMQ